MRKIGVVTTSRADYTCLRPVIARLFASQSCIPHLIVSGTHLSEHHGRTVWEIEEDGFEIGATVPINMEDDRPEGIGRSIGEATQGFADVYEQLSPDILLLLGDRFEVHAAATAANPFLLPVAHVHGGELSQGSIDDSFRHSITKLSHIHFVATDTYARRVAQMGEEEWRIVVSGAPSLDNLGDMTLLTRSDLEKRLGIELQETPLLVTYHPATLAGDEGEIDEILGALETFEGAIVFTAPNADPGNQVIRSAIERFVGSKPKAILVEDLGPLAYFSLMSVAAAMLGNSSSGLIEAPSFGLPVVNVGPRQEGRLRAGNVIDVDANVAAISDALSKVLDPTFRARLRNSVNPFGDGLASQRIVEHLADQDLGDALIKKRFVDLGASS